MLITARRVGIHGFCRAKNVRVSSRLTPANGSEIANHSSAIETMWV
jgi:hypothetical protein